MVFFFPFLSAITTFMNATTNSLLCVASHTVHLVAQTSRSIHPFPVTAHPALGVESWGLSQLR